jgi:hypothetical protein
MAAPGCWSSPWRPGLTRPGCARRSCTALPLPRTTTTPAPARFSNAAAPGGDTKLESVRALKRRLSDVVYRALLGDEQPGPADLTPAA